MEYEESTITITLNADMDIFATFNENPTLYTLSLLADSQEGGTLTGEGKYEEGQEVTIIAKPNQGFLFSGWYSNDNLMHAVETHTFEIPAYDYKIHGIFHIVNTINKMQKGNMSIFPNPAKNIMKVSAASEIQNIRIMDITGKVVWEGHKVKSQKYHVDISGFATGIYSVQVLKDNKIFVQKLIIQ